jgi:hypothetical protein
MLHRPCTRPSHVNQYIFSRLSGGLVTGLAGECCQPQVWIARGAPYGADFAYGFLLATYKGWIVPAKILGSSWSATHNTKHRLGPPAFGVDPGTTS